VIHVEQLSASTMIPKEAQFMKKVARQNGQNQIDVANFPLHFVLGILGAM